MGAAHLERARKHINDEFYTPLEAVKNECDFYLDAFKGKVIYSNCDSFASAFKSYFLQLWAAGVIKRYICSGIDPQTREPFFLDTADPWGWAETGNCFIAENRRRIREADIIITNPPFSKLGHYMAMILAAKKDFITVIPLTFIRRPLLLPRLKAGTIRMGYTKFDIDGARCYWITSLPVRKAPAPLAPALPAKLHYYDGTDIINIDRTDSIPAGWPYLLGVPIYALQKLAPDQYDIIDIVKPHINGRALYDRVIIKLRGSINEDYQRYKRTDRARPGGLLSLFS